MKAVKVNPIIIETVRGLGMRIFEIAVHLGAFLTFYLTLFSPLTITGARVFALLPALALAYLFLLLYKKKKLKWCIFAGAVAYTVVCIAIFPTFSDGACIFANSIASVVNQNLHRGWEFITVEYSGVADFLFTSMLAVWIALGTVALTKWRGISFIIASVIVIIAWLIIGIFPSFFGLIPLVIWWTVLLTVDKGFTLRAILCYFAVTVSVACLIVPCMLYPGSAGVRQLRNNISNSADVVAFGTDTLPQGKLKNAGKLHDGDSDRLVVTLSSRTPTLYLKGFVGNSIDEFDTWQPTDKNVYVENMYQGLLDYVDEQGLPFMQYAKYMTLSGKADDIPITVENIGANRKYMYVPYGLNSYESGDKYYDLNMRRSAFSSNTYSYSVFGGDFSGEWTIQERWLFDQSIRTVDMKTYMKYENEYRAFVYDTYCDIDDDIANIIRERLFGISTDSINTAARLLRTYFEENFFLTDDVDAYDTDFLADFYGGKIKNANAVYFASAATYAFRALGFASRYAEGYLVETESGESGAHTVTVTDEAAHAWTEVYFDGIGWLPIEVTFEVSDPHVPIDPEDPEDPVDPKPTDPNETEDPDDPNKKPDTPEIPVFNENEGMSMHEGRLLKGLKILLPMLCVALFILIVMLGLGGYRQLVMRRRRRMLDCNGEKYGRTVYDIVNNSCKSFGGFDEEMLAERGVSVDYTRRFIQLVERCVYGGYDLNLNEKNFTVDYVKRVARALEGDSKFDKFICRYIKCIGIG